MIKLSDTFKCTCCKQIKENREFCRKKDARRIRRFASKCKECDRKRVEKYAKTRVFKKLAKQQQLKYKFSLSIERWNKMLEEQNYSCAICETAQKDLNKTLCVDHDHKTGKVRGLLCHNCNVALGSFRDNSKILVRAIEYLKSKEFQEVKLLE